MDELYGRDLVRLWWVDYAGVRRIRVVPARRMKENKNSRIGITPAALGMPAVQDTAPPLSKLSPVGECWLNPDWDHLIRYQLEESRRSVPFVPVTFHEVTEDISKATHISPWPYCPRSLLQRVTDNIKTEFGIEIRAGFEIEFLLMEEDGKGPPLGGSGTYCAAEKYEIASEFLGDLNEILENIGIKVTQLHAESANGQYEVALTFADPLTAADKLVTAREIIASLALRNKMRASFSPKPSPDQAGNGLHVHLSIWKNGENLFDISAGEFEQAIQSASSEPGMFIAGILRSVHALVAITGSSPLSFYRLVPGAWSGAYAAWGMYNREAAIRVLPRWSNFEYKAMDASANPHLALAALCAAGAYGIQNKLQLPKPCTTDPASDPTLSSLRLPSTLEHALHYLSVSEEGDSIRNAFGMEIIDAFCETKRLEHLLGADLSLQQLQEQYLFRY
eukprot:CAMPEP_0182442974 /NCGR_PEP_ID=MMETSP1172-20130603/1824_1 /TAXON_ID=708627 /ORGANISM="Timspurckia oligopyrenoides, Strain CCMP3278" /LENGTH=448 /DNA_ID=CAMNT_0024638095 /DNA_START=59 /DNA_END=1405 /DNA_ORIENTATION=-